MESISRLRAGLLAALGSRGLQDGGQALFDELFFHHATLLNLLDVGPRSQQEMRELESGKITIDGKAVAVNADFVRQVAFISQQLDCSEKYISSLLQHVMLTHPNVNSTTAIESAIIEFHKRRRDLVDCIEYILEAAETFRPGVPRLYERLAQYAQDNLVQLAKGDAALAPRIIKQLVRLGSEIAKTQAAKQGATANTTAPSQQGNGSLGYDIIEARLESLNYERRTLATALTLIARSGSISIVDIQTLIESLSADPDHALSYYTLTTVLSIFNSEEPTSNGGKLRKALALDSSLLAFMKRKFDPSVSWKNLGLKATLLLKWTLFLTEIRHHDPTLEIREGFHTEELETQIWNAVQGDAFTYILEVIQHLQKKSGHKCKSSYAHNISLTPDQEMCRQVPSDEFREKILFAFENLIRSLITYASSELRKIKQRQEDLVHSASRTDRSHRFRSASAPAPSNAAQATTRNDIALLFALTGVLYEALPPEKALQFWGAGPQPGQTDMTYLEYSEFHTGRLPAFLQWSVWSTQSRDLDMSMALYDMLSGLSNGQQCSELAYNFMARGSGEVLDGSGISSTQTNSSTSSVSWKAIFTLLESWAIAGASSNPAAASSDTTIAAKFNLSLSQPRSMHQVQQHQVELSAKEVLLAQAFLRMLSTTVSCSFAVRVALSGNPHFRAIPTIIALVPMGIPLELKGALFESLAAFCEPGGPAQGVEICKAVWTLMEKLEVINVRAPSRLVVAVKGVEVELEEVESVYKLYPATLPFLKLLATLIYTPKRSHPVTNKTLDLEVVSAITIPETLGQSYRAPGIRPYVAFVIDNVFLKIPTREYLHASDRWVMNDVCLAFVERVLASYDLESLLSPVAGSSINRETVIRLIVHPGYDVMSRLLTNSPFQASLLSYLLDGVEGFDKGLAEQEPLFQSTIVRAMRIALRLLEIQDLFIDLLIPITSDFDTTNLIETVHARSYFTKFDQALSFGSQYVPAIAAYVAHLSCPEIVLLSVKILAALSAAPISTSMATLLEQSADSDRILDGYRQIIAAENFTDVAESEIAAEQVTGAGAGDPSNSFLLAQATRVAALDFFISNVNPDQPNHNIALFLLFGGTGQRQHIQDPHALGAKLTSIHVILNLVNANVPDSESEANQIYAGDPLMIRLPSLAEKCYRVIYQLCIHPYTSESTMRYLRTREKFFARHLAAIPSQAPRISSLSSVEVRYDDGARVVTSVPALTSFLRLHSCVMDLVALELHVETSKGRHRSVTQILEVLFGQSSLEVPLNEGDWSSHVSGQSQPRIIETVVSLAFDWSDSITADVIELEYFGKLDLQSCVQLDSVGCEIIDRNALQALLVSTKRMLQSQGRLMTAADLERINNEVKYIAESCVVENHRRSIQHATARGYQAWKRLLDTSLNRCFRRIPYDSREDMIFGLLQVLPQILRSSILQDDTATTLAEAIVSCMTRLREDRQRQEIMQSAAGGTTTRLLPVERLNTFFESLTESILEDSRFELVRGNIYAALTSYCHLIGTASDPRSLNETKGVLGQMATHHNSNLSDAGSQIGGNTKIASVNILPNRKVTERLVAMVSRDAIDGTEVWKTMSFMFLDALVRVSRLQKPNVVATALSQGGLMSNFVRSLKDTDGQLQGTLKPDPEDLNPLYVYEAKVSFLIRMAQMRAGAERLLDAQLISIMAQCDYLDARPEMDHDFIDQDSFLPSAIQRYHQLFIPALQLLSSLSVTLGSGHVTCAQQILSFLSSHRDTVVLLLKADIEQIAISTLEEMHLLTILCTGVLSLIPRKDLATPNSAFGAIHSAILALAARCLRNSAWLDGIRPETDGEHHDASRHITSPTSVSIFSLAVSGKAMLLRKALAMYLTTACDGSGLEFHPVLSPSTAPPRQDSSFAAIIPTLGDALGALNDFCAAIRDTMYRIRDLHEESTSKEYSRLNDFQHITDTLGEQILQSLPVVQKRALLLAHYEERIKNEKIDTKKMIDTVEMLLILLWRHLIHYKNTVHVRGDSLQCLMSIEELDLDLENTGADDVGYIKVLGRRLRDVVAVNDTG